MLAYASPVHFFVTMRKKGVFRNIYHMRAINGHHQSGFCLPLFLKLNCFKSSGKFNTMYDIEVKSHVSRDERFWVPEDMLSWP